MPITTGSVHFGPFELDTRSGELRKQGLPIRLQEQPFKILSLLLERPGEIATREELQHQLWPSDTFVDFDHSLNAAVKRLRETLGDDADHPRYIETLPRHGYRWIAPVTHGDAVPTRERNRQLHSQAWKLLAIGIVALLFLGVALAKWYSHSLWRTQPAALYSLAVLPFENLSGKPDQEYFSDSLTEDLINQLSRVQGLRVISRQSVMHYKGAVKTLPEIAAELNVQAIVQGSVLRNDGHVRITLQLVRAVPEQHLWAESYERSLTDVIDLQREIAGDVVRQVQAALAVPAPTASSRRP